MPFSSGEFRSEIRDFILSRGYISAVLDIGAGAGYYARLFPEFAGRMDAVEVYRPYVKRFHLNDLYRRVYVGNITERIKGLELVDYRMAIMGDVLEHLSVADASLVLGQLRENMVDALVVVPFLYPQGVVDGNKYEVHLQPDLTPAVMAERYPEISPVFESDKIGVYFQNWSKL